MNNQNDWFLGYNSNIIHEWMFYWQIKHVIY
jgi:hypothetical protein